MAEGRDAAHPPKQVGVTRKEQEIEWRNRLFEDRMSQKGRDLLLQKRLLARLQRQVQGQARDFFRESLPTSPS